MNRLTPLLLVLCLLGGCAPSPQDFSPGPSSASSADPGSEPQPARPDARNDASVPAHPRGQPLEQQAPLEAPGAQPRADSAEPAVAEAAGRRDHVEAHAKRSHEQAPHALSALRPATPPDAVVRAPHWTHPADRERYQAITSNPVKLVSEAPVSTFSIDVDTGSYANVRRFLTQGRLPPADAVRVEELVNYFPFDYAQPDAAVPFAIHSELTPSPWNPKNVLLRIGIKGRDVAKQSLPAANVVFLVDVSGSMSTPDKLPLLKSALKLLVKEMRAQDRITLVTYAGRTAVVLEPTPGSEGARIAAAIDALHAGGSTAGASGIELAYRMAQQSFVAGGINRILLATDGDFNVGVTDFRALKSIVEERRKSGVSLSTLGFGSGNYNEQLMEQLADVGDGAYSYIDSLMEGHKVLVNELTSTLATIARDVKIQVEFNPGMVKEYRLIGYENRLLAREDFNNDRVDAGDIGAGHSVTALYELTLAGEAGLIDPLRYAPQAARPRRAGGELAHVKLRYKEPQAQTSQLIELAIFQRDLKPLAQASQELRFASAVAGFGQILRGGQYTGNWTLADARKLGAESMGADRFGYRGEFLRLVDLAQALSTRAPTLGEAAVGR